MASAAVVQGCLQYTLPSPAAQAFHAWRKQWLQGLPAALQKAVVHEPAPHITLLPECSSNKPVCVEAASAAAAKQASMECSFGDVAVVGQAAAVVVAPLRADGLVGAFHDLFDDTSVNPLGESCRMFLRSDLATASNPRGFTPHVTVAWFAEEALADLQALSDNTDLRVRVACAPFVLTDDQLEWHPLAARTEKA